DGGVLVTGAVAQETTVTSLQVVHAALRRRKPVIAVDLSGDAAVAGAVAAACRATGTPLQVFGIEEGHYEPFRPADPAPPLDTPLCPPPAPSPGCPGLPARGVGAGGGGPRRCANPGPGRRPAPAQPPGPADAAGSRGRGEPARAPAGAAGRRGRADRA